MRNRARDRSNARAVDPRWRWSLGGDQTHGRNELLRVATRGGSYGLVGGARPWSRPASSFASCGGPVRRARDAVFGGSLARSAGCCTTTGAPSGLERGRVERRPLPDLRIRWAEGTWSLCPRGRVRSRAQGGRSGSAARRGPVGGPAARLAGTGGLDPGSGARDRCGVTRGDRRATPVFGSGFGEAGRKCPAPPVRARFRHGSRATRAG
jgi:hypothetical protein